MSNKPYDWLGEGAYFWEGDPLRAYQWAESRRSDAPCIVGAVIDLASCLDLTLQSGVQAVRLAYESYERLRSESGEPPLFNEEGQGSNPGDRVIRLLDRAVIDHLHAMYKARAEPNLGPMKEFGTVRALFPEGAAIYPTAGFRAKTHVQIAVRDLRSIRGVFRLPQHELELHRLPSDIYDELH